MAGLTAGLLAMRGGHDVTVLDRGRGLIPAGPAEAWDRWPRLHQPHACLPGLRDRLQQHFPQVYRSVLGGGAVEFPAPGGGTAMGCRRTTLELALRQHARTAGIQVEHATTVTGLDTLHGQVTAVHVLAGRTARTIRAEVVIDATGRNTKVCRWLPGVARQTGSAAGSTVWSRFYVMRRPLRLAGGVSESARGPGPGWRCYGFVSDGDTCSLSLSLPSPRRRPCPGEFDAAIAAVPFARRMRRLCSPVGPVRVVPGLRNVMRRCSEPGLLLTGDALLTTTPAHGLGMMLATDQAVLLSEVLGAARNPREAARQWAAAAEDRYMPYFRAADAEDAGI